MKAAHPTRRYEDLRLETPPDLLDNKLQLLLLDLGHSGFLTADLDLPSYAMERSATLHIGKSGLPRWGELNRTYSGVERRTFVRDALETVLYWNIQLSRLGPFWIGYWNTFVLTKGEVRVEVCAPPESTDWRHIIDTTTATLRKHHYTAVPKELLDQPVQWLTTAQAYLLTDRNQPPHPTVSNVLFYDLV